MIDINYEGLKRDYANAHDHRCNWSTCDSPAANRLVSGAHGEEWFCGDHFIEAVEETIEQDELLDVGVSDG